MKSLMDPPLINEGSFATSNPSLSEIWPFNNGGNCDGRGMLGLRMGNGGFVNGLIDGLFKGDGSMEESTVTGQSGSLDGSNGRKRRENFSEDESSKLFSTITSANELVTILFFFSFFDFVLVKSDLLTINCVRFD